MKRINNRHVAEAAQHAQEAHAEGQTVLVYKLAESKDYNRWSSAPLPGAAAQIQAIEAEGWALANMTGEVEKCELICLFRRTG